MMAQPMTGIPLSQMPRMPGLSPAGPAGPQAPPLDSALAIAFQDRLSRHIEAQFTAAQRWKDGQITPILHECLRRRRGEYDADKLAQIQALGGCDTNFNLTESKCATLHAWLEDFTGAAGEDPWALDPTPVPDLPPPAMQEIYAAILQQFAPEYATVQQAVAAMPPDQAANLVQQLVQRVQQSAKQMHAQVTTRVLEEARDAANKLSAKVADQLREGGWYQAMAEVLSDFCTFPLAIMAGPEIEGTRRQRWTDTGCEVVVEPVLSYHRVSPFDFFPSPQCRTVQDEYVCERVRYSIPDLDALSQTPGWLPERLGTVIREFIASKQPLPLPSGVQPDPTRAMLENRYMSESVVATSTLEGIKYWGYVSGHDLLDWSNFNETTLAQHGFANVEEAKWYHVNALQLGRYCVQLMPVLDPLGRRPYAATSFEKVPGSLWGRSVPQKVAPWADAFTATLRNMINALAFVSGPMLQYDSSLYKAGPVSKLQPWSIFSYDGTKIPPGAGARRPFDFYQHQANLEQYLRVAEYCSAQSEESTGIFKYVAGSMDIKGGAQTATGLGMLMSAAGKVIKRSASFVDEDIIRPEIDMTVAFDNRYSTDPTLRGDVRVVPRGAVALIAKEQTWLRQKEFLETAINPALAGRNLVPDEGLAIVLRGMAKRADLPGERVVATDDRIQQAAAELQAMQDAMLASQQAGAQGGAGNARDVGVRGGQGPQMRPGAGGVVSGAA
jgi:hypothetical protein